MGFDLSRTIPWADFGRSVKDVPTGSRGRLGTPYVDFPHLLQIFRTFYDPAEWPAGSSKSMYMM